MTFFLSGTCVAKPLLPHNFHKLNRLSFLRVSKAFLSVFKWLSWLFTVPLELFRRVLRTRIAILCVLHTIHSNSMCLVSLKSLASSSSLLSLQDIQGLWEVFESGLALVTAWCWNFTWNWLSSMILEPLQLFFSEMLFPTLQLLFLLLLPKPREVFVLYHGWFYLSSAADNAVQITV